MARSLLFRIIVGGLLFVSPAFAQTPTPDTGKLEITVSGLRSQNGKVAISVFEKAKSSAFPGDGSQAIETFYLDIKPGADTVTATTKALPYGVYAVSLMHNEKGDGKFATFLGIPKDGFGFSKNPRILVGAPNYQACAFELNQEKLEVPIKVKYMF
jgi:uncharacterized protein (DUF2141 family)